MVKIRDLRQNVFRNKLNFLKSVSYSQNLLFYKKKSICFCNSENIEFDYDFKNSKIVLDAPVPGKVVELIKLVRIHPLLPQWPRSKYES